MITPVVKALTKLGDDWGDTEDDFWVMLQADIGPKDDRGSDTFTFYVTSPKRLEKILQNNQIQVGRGMFIINDFDMNKIDNLINRLTDNCKRVNWNEVVFALCRYFYWEYDE